jgi:hypothetical protein
MTTMSHRRKFATLTAGALLAVPATTLAHPPADSVPAGPSRAAQLLKSYEMNSASGSYAPPRTDSTGVGPIHTQIGPAAVHKSAAAAASEEGFSVADAAAGAGFALLLGGGLALGTRSVIRRRHVPARIG